VIADWFLAWFVLKVMTADWFLAWFLLKVTNWLNRAECFFA